MIDIPIDERESKIFNMLVNFDGIADYYIHDLWHDGDAYVFFRSGTEDAYWERGKNTDDYEPMEDEYYPLSCMEKRGIIRITEASDWRGTIEIIGG